MSVFLIIVLSAFAVGLCAVEIPKMAKDKLYRELWAFSIVLGIGVILAALEILEVKLFNPSDIVKTAYSSVTELMKGVLEP